VKSLSLLFLLVGCVAGCALLFDFDHTAASGGAGGMSTSPSSSWPSSSLPSSSPSSSSASGMPCGTGNSVCVPEAPSGWSGYFTLYDGPPAMAPGCPTLFPLQSYSGHGGLAAPAAICSPCTCGPPTGQSCTVGTFQGVGPLFVTNKTCAQFMMGPACGLSRTVIADGSCVITSPIPAGLNTCGDLVNNQCPGGNQPCNVGAAVGPAQASGGACPASPQNPSKPPATWTTLGRACGYQGSTLGCAGGQMCLPATSAPYRPGICVSRAGNFPCPPEFPNKHLYHDGFTDTRTCSPCTCGPVTGDCSAMISLYNDSQCATQPIASIPAGGCADLTGNPGVLARKAVAQLTGSCAAIPAQPSGGVVGENPVTYCCQ